MLKPGVLGCEDVLKRTLMALTIKSRFSKWDLMKIKSLYKAKDICGGGGKPQWTGGCIAGNSSMMVISWAPINTREFMGFQEFIVHFECRWSGETPLKLRADLS